MKRYPLALLMLVAVALALSGLAPHDRTTWWLEIFPILIGVPLLVATHRRFPLTRLLYTLLAVHAVILIVGGHYTYARVPLGFWAQELFGFTRNHYDRLGHFAQGFIPAILVREVLLRTSPLRPGRWLFVLVTAVCDGAGRRGERRGLPGDAGRRMGHPMGHVLRADRSDYRPARAERRA